MLAEQIEDRGGRGKQISFGELCLILFNQNTLHLQKRLFWLLAQTDKESFIACWVEVGERLSKDQETLAPFHNVPPKLAVLIRYLAGNSLCARTVRPEKMNATAKRIAQSGKCRLNLSRKAIMAACAV